MSLSLFSLRSQKKLNFWDETETRNQSLFFRSKVKIPAILGNQRFANEVPIDSSTMTEREFRSLSGFSCRSLHSNGYFKLQMRPNYMKITMWKKPFRSSEISVLVIGEFIVIHAEHKRRIDNLEDVKEFSKSSDSDDDDSTEDIPEELKMRECGITSRTLTRRYMLPSGVNRRNVSYFTKESMDVLYVFARWLTSPKPPHELEIPIVVEKNEQKD